MTRTKTAARAAIAGLALSALGLLVATPASAHTNSLYTLVLPEEAEANWATLDRTNGDATLLPEIATNEGGETVGAEIFNESAFAIIHDDFQEISTWSIFSWDHTTGAEGPLVPITFPDASLLSLVSGLDTLPDGTLLTYIEYDIFEGGGEFPDFHAAIASIDPTTGVVTPLVIVDDVLFDDSFDFDAESLATDPTSGITYLFLEDNNDNTSYFLPANVAAGTFTDAVQFEGTGFAPGFFQGADFDVDGTLYFIFGNDNEEIYELSHLGVVSTWPTAEREYLGDAAGNIGENALDPLNLTIEYTPPALAATGAEFSGAWAVAGLVAVLAGAVTVVTTRRRSRAVV